MTSTPEEKTDISYSHEQVGQYFDRLGIPGSERHYDVSKLGPEDALKYLALLQKQHLAHIPFENLTLHYSPHRQISLHHEEIFRKIIGDNNGRGGYCMENNYLFNIFLRAIGFNIYAAGGRVFDKGTWTGWSHMVNLVTIGDMKYQIDVGFGGEGPVVPMPLDRSGPVQSHITPSIARLQWRNIPGNSDPNQRLWVYELKRSTDDDWNIMYCFTETEFLPGDFNIMNFYTSTHHKTFFTRTIVVDKKVLDETGELVGDIILNGNILKWRVHGVKQKEVELKSEEERVNAIEKHLGIKFGQVERDGIKGLVSEIK